MKKFGIVAKKDETSIQIEQIVKEKLTEKGWVYDKKNPQLVLCIGGDGTFLYAVHKYLDIIDNCSFLAIHTGTLGFFTDYTIDEVDECIFDVVNKDPIIRSVPLLKIVCENEAYYAVNEMRIENVVRTQLLDVKIDGVLFETFRGTGMCVSTQSGSTAYNRSLKGAVIEEGLNLLQLHEITGIHHQKYRSLGVPYIMDPHRKIEFFSDNFHDAILCYDQKHLLLDHAKKVEVSLSDKKVHFAKYRNINYLERLRDLY
ncbi:NAD kinase [uncultured Traorella sp.]|uniref:NAD kinase n=1 Tax=uncultured Traorella sp. TaxID=1929048 RepID=UPI0025CDAA56|nr:NAD kinase [uncultured Traorella sp.]